MSWPAWIVRELWGLFVDDGALALLSLLWIVVAGYLLPRLLPALAEGWPGPAILFLGFALILAESALRAARRRRDRP